MNFKARGAQERTEERGPYGLIYLDLFLALGSEGGRASGTKLRI